MDGSATYPDWIAVDWGTTRLRAWGLSADGKVLAQATSDRGMGNLSPDQFEGALLDTIGGWVAGPTQVIACGMVGSRQGWVEAPYHAVPCAPLPGGFAQAPVTDARLQVYVIPGLKQSSPADVMRGEETQIAGFLATHPGFDGVICLPGTHTKWVQISAGEVVSFQTLMTGELFSLLASASVLRHSISADGWNDDAFNTAVSDSLSKPEKLAARLFTLRAEGLLEGLDKSVARARASGHLIGAELAATRAYWLGQEVAILGAKEISAAYAAALSAQGAAPHLADGTAMTLAGLTAARAQLIEA